MRGKCIVILFYVVVFQTEPQGKSVSDAEHNVFSPSPYLKKAFLLLSSTDGLPPDYTTRLPPNHYLAPYADCNYSKGALYIPPL